MFISYAKDIRRSGMEELKIALSELHKNCLKSDFSIKYLVLKWEKSTNEWSYVIYLGSRRMAEVESYMNWYRWVEVKVELAKRYTLKINGDYVKHVKYKGKHDMFEKEWMEPKKVKTNNNKRRVRTKNSDSKTGKKEYKQYF